MVAKKSKLWSARRSMGYAGKELDRGEIFCMVGARNDEKLIRLGYVNSVKKNSPVFECGKCGRKFTEMQMRDGHVKGVHPKRPRTAVEEVEFMEKKDEQESRQAPLYLDRTKASKGERPRARA